MSMNPTLYELLNGAPTTRDGQRIRKAYSESKIKQKSFSFLVGQDAEGELDDGYSEVAVEDEPSVKVGSGWNNGDDQTPMMTDAAGCSYLDPWVGTNAAPPSPLCTS